MSKSIKFLTIFVLVLMLCPFFVSAGIVGDFWNKFQEKISGDTIDTIPYNSVNEINKIITENVTCAFKNLVKEGKCFISDGKNEYSCVAYADSTSNSVPTCSMVVSGEKGKDLTWKSSCGGYDTVTIDGEDEYVKFDCGEAVAKSYCEYSVENEEYSCRLSKNDSLTVGPVKISIFDIKPINLYEQNEDAGRFRVSLLINNLKTPFFKISDEYSLLNNYILSIQNIDDENGLIIFSVKKKNHIFIEGSSYCKYNELENKNYCFLTRDDTVSVAGHNIRIAGIESINPNNGVSNGVPSPQLPYNNQKSVVAWLVVDDKKSPALGVSDKYNIDNKNVLIVQNIEFHDIESDGDRDNNIAFTINNIIGESACKDDDGDNIYTYGAISGLDKDDEGNPPADYCWDNNSGLMEGVCTDSGYVNFISHECPNGCSDGACITSVSSVDLKVVGVYFDYPPETYFIDNSNDLVTHFDIKSYGVIPKKFKIDLMVFDKDNNNVDGCGTVVYNGDFKTAYCGINDFPKAGEYIFKVTVDKFNDIPEANEKNNVYETLISVGSVGISSVNSSSCKGCFIDGNCYNYGYRKDKNFCSYTSGWINQFADASTCDNNFECNSNLCINSECISGSLFSKIIDWFKVLFS